MGVAAYSTPTQAPCDDCPHFASCRATGTICAAFVSFVSAESRNAWRARPRVPNAKLTAHIWKIEANESAEADEKSRRALRRRARRKYRKLHPDAFQRYNRRWLEKNRETHRAGKLRWYYAHREQALAARKAWGQRNAERVRQRRRERWLVIRDRVNAELRARRAIERKRRAVARQAAAVPRIGQVRARGEGKGIQPAVTT